MSPLSEIRFVAQRELGKSFRSVKGIVLLVLSLLGGTGATLLIVKATQLKRDNLGDVSPEVMRSMRESATTKTFGDPLIGKSLADAPEVLVAVLVLTIWLTPMVIALLGFDSVAGDLQHKAVRYWTLRTRRASYFIGKWAGTWGTISIMTFAMHAMIWVVCIFRGEATAAVALGWGLRFWLLTLPISAVWCGIGTLVSSLFKAPMISLLVTLTSFFVLWLVWMAGMVTGKEFLLYAYPNFYDSLLIHPHANRAVAGLAACIAMAAAYLGAGSYLFAKRDV